MSREVTSAPTTSIPKIPLKNDLACFSDRSWGSAWFCILHVWGLGYIRHTRAAKCGNSLSLYLPNFADRCFFKSWKQAHKVLVYKFLLSSGRHSAKTSKNAYKAFCGCQTVQFYSYFRCSSLVVSPLFSWGFSWFGFFLPFLLPGCGFCSQALTERHCFYWHFKWLT